MRTYPDREHFRLEKGPRDVGFDHIARDRASSYLPDAMQCDIVRDPRQLFDAVSKVLVCRDLTRVSAIADPAALEFLAEADVLHRRRFREPLPHWVVAMACTEGLDSIDFTFMLGDRELQSLEDYCWRYERQCGGDAMKDDNLVVFLGDNASTHASWSFLSHQLPTARTNAGLFWALKKRRWLTSRQLLAAAGIPQKMRHLQALGVPAHFARYLDFESYNTRRQHAGNLVHCALAGTFIAVCLASIELRRHHVRNR